MENWSNPCYRAHPDWQKRSRTRPRPQVEFEREKKLYFLPSADYKVVCRTNSIHLESKLHLSRKSIGMWILAILDSSRMYLT
jgi:hypothetical protein